MLNEKDKREAIRRQLHDFVMLKLSGDTKIGEVAALLEKATSNIYCLFAAEVIDHAEMIETMRNSGYFRGPSGLANMVKDVKNFREYFDRIRKALGVAGIGYLASDITERVEQLAKEHRTQQQRNFDYIAHNDMRAVLEDAGYSPDADGIKALLDELQKKDYTVTHIEGVLDGVDPQLRKELPLESAVSVIGGSLLRAREQLRQIHRTAAEELNR